MIETAKSGQQKVCPNCGTTLGQKNVCPVCHPEAHSVEAVQGQDTCGQLRWKGSQREEVGKLILSLKHLSLIKQLEGEQNVRDDANCVNLKGFIDQHGDQWELAFDQEFGKFPLREYEMIFDACQKLFKLRNFLLECVDAASTDRITPPLMISTLKSVLEKFPELQTARETIRQWFRELFQKKIAQTQAFQDFAYAFKIGGTKDLELGEMMYVSPENMANNTTSQLMRPVWIMRDWVSVSAWNRIMQVQQARTQNSFQQNYISNVTWEDAMIFCQKLTEYTRKHNAIPDNYEYTLPDRNLFAFLDMKRKYPVCQGMFAEDFSYHGLYSEWLWDHAKEMAKNPNGRQVFSYDYYQNPHTLLYASHKDARYGARSFRCILAPVRSAYL